MDLILLLNHVLLVLYVYLHRRILLYIGYMNNMVFNLMLKINFLLYKFYNLYLDLLLKNVNLMKYLV